MRALFIILICPFIFNHGQEIKLKIGVPEYICDKNDKDSTTIRFLGRDAQDLHYKFQINFKRIGGNCRNQQRCNLLTWKAVRDLDKFLQNYPPELMKTGLIEISNSMFAPGIEYILNVTIMKENRVVEHKSLTLGYINDEMEKRAGKPIASLQLLGSDFSYAYTNYILSAEATICSNITSYSYKWQIFDEVDSQVKELYEMGDELNIKPNVFQGGKMYKIRSDLVDDNNNNFANSIQNVNVLSKGLVLHLPVKYYLVRSNQPVKINNVVQDMDNTDGDMEVTWDCLNRDTGEKCFFLNGINELDSEFATPGRYNITVEVKKGTISRIDSCVVEVKDNVPHVEFDDVEYPVNPASGVEIRATIYYLRNFCSLKWDSVNGSDYQYVDLSKMPGNNLVVNVTMADDYFPHELEEYRNGTLDKSFTLIIPPPSGNWEGLMGDSKYIFRLTVKCPENVESIMIDFTIETNAPPKMKQLQVMPLYGEAFLTSFRFKTEKAEDKPDQSPILYRFGYILNQKEIVLWSLNDVTNIAATLPYSSDGIQTFVEGCDNYSSCARTWGPIIQTRMPTQKNSNFYQKMLETFSQKLHKEEYYKALSTAFAVLCSFKNNSEEFERYFKFISEKLTAETEKFLETENIPTHRRDAANNLIKNFNEFNTELKLPEQILLNFINIRNKLAFEGHFMERRILAQLEVANAPNLQDIKNYIEVSESIITSADDSQKVSDEKENLRQQILQYVQEMCRILYSKNQIIQLEMKTLILSVEKVNRNAFTNYIEIPYERNAWNVSARIKLSSELYEENKGTPRLCVAKAVFNNYLRKDGMIFMSELVSGEGGTILHRSEEILIVLPKNGSEGCSVFRDGWHTCKVLQIVEKYIKCSCNNLGFFYATKSITTSPSTVTDDEEVMTTTVFETSETEDIGNISQSRQESKRGDKSQIVSYAIIGGSVIGIVIIGFVLRKILQDDDDEEALDDFDFPKYAPLYDEELLNDSHI